MTQAFFMQFNFHLFPVFYFLIASIAFSALTLRDLLLFNLNSLVQFLHARRGYSILVSLLKYTIYIAFKYTRNLSSQKVSTLPKFPDIHKFPNLSGEIETFWDPIQKNAIQATQTFRKLRMEIDMALAHSKYGIFLPTCYFRIC